MYVEGDCCIFLTTNTWHCYQLFSQGQYKWKNRCSYEAAHRDPSHPKPPGLASIDTSLNPVSHSARFLDLSKWHALYEKWNIVLFDAMFRSQGLGI